MPTLLMIHGIGCDASAWDRMKPIFEAGGWTCEAITLFADRRVKTNPPESLPELSLQIISMRPLPRRRGWRRGTGRSQCDRAFDGGLIAQVLAERERCQRRCS